MGEFQELQKKVKKLGSLLEASKGLHLTMDTDVVLSRIMWKMLHMTEAEVGTLWLFDQGKNVIKAKVVEGYSKDEIFKIQLKLGEGIVGKVIQTGEPTLIEDATKEVNGESREDDKTDFITRTMMTIPLVVQEEAAIGALQVLNKTGNRLFHEEDLKFAVLLGSQLALILHHSQTGDEIDRMSTSKIRALTKAIEARDPYMSGHAGRVAKYSVWTAKKLGYSKEACDNLERAALLHDIGKIGIPDSILTKQGKLSDAEFKIIKEHTVIGANIVSEMAPKKMMALATEVAQSHHERLDGSGYPYGLCGDDISFDVKIVAVTDSFDAMTMDRPYHQARSYHEGIDELLRCRGRLYDKKAVDVFLSILKEENY